MVEMMDDANSDSKDQVGTGASGSEGRDTVTFGGGLNVPEFNQFGSSSRIFAQSFRLISKMLMMS